MSHKSWCKSKIDLRKKVKTSSTLLKTVEITTNTSPYYPTQDLPGELTLTGSIEKKPWTKSEESYFAGGSDYFVAHLKHEGQSMPPAILRVDGTNIPQVRGQTSSNINEFVSALDKLASSRKNVTLIGKYERNHHCFDFEYHERVHCSWHCHHFQPITLQVCVAKKPFQMLQMMQCIKPRLVQVSLLWSTHSSSVRSSNDILLLRPSMNSTYCRVSFFFYWYHVRPRGRKCSNLSPK